MSLNTSKVALAEYLQTDEGILEYLEDVLKTGSEEDFINAISIAARAHGMTKIAEKAGVSRTSLYKSLAEGGNPSYKTVSKIAHALGFRFSLAAV